MPSHRALVWQEKYVASNCYISLSIVPLTMPPAVLTPLLLVHLADALIAFLGADRLRIASTVIGYFAFVECLLVVVFTAWNPALRRWPGTSHLVIFTCVFVCDTSQVDC